MAGMILKPVIHFYLPFILTWKIFIVGDEYVNLKFGWLSNELSNGTGFFDATMM
jgi:hypothetical protein